MHLHGDGVGRGHVPRDEGCLGSAQQDMEGKTEMGAGIMTAKI